MISKPDAKIIFLKQTRVRCSDLNRMAVRQGSMGCVVNPGDQLSAYQVDVTVPEGPVLVTDTTRFVFAN